VFHRASIELEDAVFWKSTSGAEGRDGEDRAHRVEPDKPIELLYVANPERATMHVRADLSMIADAR
jgi:hypothetical protein